MTGLCRVANYGGWSSWIRWSHLMSRPTHHHHDGWGDGRWSPCWLTLEIPLLRMVQNFEPCTDCCWSEDCLAPPIVPSIHAQSWVTIKGTHICRYHGEDHCNKPWHNDLSQLLELTWTTRGITDSSNSCCSIKKLMQLLRIELLSSYCCTLLTWCVCMYETLLLDSTSISRASPVAAFSSHHWLLVHWCCQHLDGFSVHQWKPVSVMTQ